MTWRESKYYLKCKMSFFCSELLTVSASDYWLNGCFNLHTHTISVLLLPSPLNFGHLEPESRGWNSGLNLWGPSRIWHSGSTPSGGVSNVCTCYTSKIKQNHENFFSDHTLTIILTLHLDKFISLRAKWIAKLIIKFNIQSIDCDLMFTGREEKYWHLWYF